MVGLLVLSSPWDGLRVKRISSQVGEGEGGKRLKGKSEGKKRSTLCDWTTIILLHLHIYLFGTLLLGRGTS